MEKNFSTTNKNIYQFTKDFSQNKDESLIITSQEKQKVILSNLKSGESLSTINFTSVSDKTKKPSIHSDQSYSQNNAIIRFSSKYSSDKMKISKSGFMVTYCSLQGNYEYAISNRGINRGIHYFEFFCPCKTQNIDIGVINEQFFDVSGRRANKKNAANKNKSSKQHVFTFHDDLPRLVGLLIDFNSNQIYLFRNNIMQTNILKISTENKKDEWFLFIKMCQQGHSISLNPFCSNPFQHLPFYYPRHDKIIENRSEEIGNLLQQVYDSFTIIKESQDQKQQEQLSEFAIDNNVVHSSFLNNESILLVNGEKIKLVVKNKDLNKYQLNPGFFQNKPLDINDKILLQTTRNLIISLLTQISWNNVLECYITQQELIYFLKTINESQNKNESVILFEFKFQSIYSVVSGLIKYLFHNLQELIENSKQTLVKKHNVKCFELGLSQQVKENSEKQIKKEKSKEKKEKSKKNNKKTSEEQIFYEDSQEQDINKIFGKLVSGEQSDSQFESQNIKEEETKEVSGDNKVKLTTEKNLEEQIDYYFGDKKKEKSKKNSDEQLFYDDSQEQDINKMFGKMVSEEQSDFQNTKEEEETKEDKKEQSKEQEQTKEKTNEQTKEEKNKNKKKKSEIEDLSPKLVDESSKKTKNKSKKNQKKTKNKQISEDGENSDKKEFDETQYQKSENLIKFEIGEHFKQLSNQPLSLELTYQLIQQLFILEEQLYSMSLSSDTKPELNNIFKNQQKRLHTQYGRLQSLLSYNPTNNLDILKLSELGIFNKNELMPELSQFEDESIVLFGAQLNQFQKPALQILKSLVPESRIYDGKPTGNVAIEHSINNLPYQNHIFEIDENLIKENQENYSKISLLCRKDSEYISTLAQDGSCNIWSTDLILKRMGTINLRKPISKQTLKYKNEFSEKPECINVNANSYKDIYKISYKQEFLNSQIYGGGGNAEDLEHLIKPELLEQLKEKGYTDEVAKAALIKTQSKSLEKALEIIKQNVQYLKQCWECTNCKKPYNDFEQMCWYCYIYFPGGSTYSVQEIENFQKAETKINKELYLSQSVYQLKAGFQINFKKSFLSPLALGACFFNNTTKESLIRVRRLAFNPSYIFNNFFNNDVNFLNKEWVTDSNYRAIEYFLMGNQNLKLQVQNMNTDFPQNTQQKIQNLQIVQLQQKDVQIPDKEIIEVSWHRQQQEEQQMEMEDGSLELEIAKNEKESNQIVVLLKSPDNKTFSLHLYTVLSQINNPYIIPDSVSITLTKEIALSIAELENQYSNVNLFSNSEFAFIITKNKIHKVNLQNSQVDLIFVSEGDKVVAKFSEDAIQFLDNQQNLHSIKLDEQKKQLMTDQQLNLFQKKEIDPYHLNTQQINALQFLLSTSYVGCQPALNDSLICSSNMDDNQNLNSKHLYEFQEKSNYIQLNFVAPKTISNIDIQFSFVSHIQQQIEKQEEQKEEQKKNADNKLSTKEEKKQEDEVPSIELSQQKYIFEDSEQEGSNKEDTIKSLQEITKNTQKDHQYIPLTIFYQEGQPKQVAQNQPLQVGKYCLSNILIPDEQHAQTQHQNALFVFSSLHNRKFRVDKMTINSPLSSQDSCYPIGQGFIFAVPDLSYLKEIKKTYLETDQEGYDQFYKDYQNKKQDQYQQQVASFAEPVGAFIFEGSQTQITFELNVKRATQFIVLVPTQFRKSPNDYTSSWSNSPQCLSFVGCIGEVVDDGDISVDLIKPNNNINNNVNVNLDSRSLSLQTLDKITQFCLSHFTVEINIITSENKECWISVSDQEPNFIKPFIDIKEHQSKKERNFEALIRFTSNTFKEYLIKGIRLHSKDDINNKIKATFVGEDWSIKQLAIQPFGPVIVKYYNKNICLFSQIEALVLYYSMFDISNCSFTRKMVKLLTNEHYSKINKKAIVSFLIQLIHLNKGFIYKIQADLDLREFILFYLLQESVLAYQNQAFKFIVLLNNSENYQNQIYNCLLEFIPKISVMKELTHTGLKNFFQLLKLTGKNRSEETSKKMLSELYEIANIIQKQKHPLYNILQSNYGVLSFVLDQSAFSENSKTQLYHQQNSESIKSRFSLLQVSHKRSYVVDLYAHHSVKQIFLSFDKNQSKIPHFQVQVWTAQKDANSFTKKLIFSQYYQGWTFTQLTSLPHDNPEYKQLFSSKNQENLNSLGLSNFSNIETRYLIIQINSSVHPVHQFVNAETAIDNGLEIIPEIYGDIIESEQESSYIKELGKYFEFNQKQMKFVQKIEFQNSCVLDKFDIEGGKNFTEDAFSFYDGKGLYYQKYNRQIMVPTESDISQLYNNNINKKPQIIQNLIQKVHDLQTDLQQKLNSAGQNCSVSEIQQICNQIELAKKQIQSLKNQFDCENDPFSLNYQYQLILYYLQILKQIAEENGQLKLDQGHESKILQCLFENFIIYEQGVINQESSALLNNLVQNNISENEWITFIFYIINKYLCNKKQFDNQFYSHMKVVEYLDKVSVPLGELLSYLVIKLNIPVKNFLITQNQKKQLSFQQQKQAQQVEQQQKEHQSKQDDLTMMLSFLLLLQKGYQKIPLQVFDPRKIVHENSYCFNNCEPYSTISGTRFKCANCPNIDCCSKIECQNKHLASFKNHTFLCITEPLPLDPGRTIYKSRPLIQIPFDLIVPSTQDHKVECQKCGKNIVGIRYMCSNCESFNACESCYNTLIQNQEKEHYKYHIFLKISYAIQEKMQNKSDVALIKKLDPLLYPQKTKSLTANQKLPQLEKKWSIGIAREYKERKQSQNEESDDLESIDFAQLKKTMSTVQSQESGSHLYSQQLTTKLQVINEEKEIDLPQLDQDERLQISFSVIVWVVENQNFSDQEKIQLLSASLDLLQEILKLSSMKIINNLLRENENNLFKLVFTILKLKDKFLIEKLQITINNFISPLNTPLEIDQQEYKKLQPSNKNKITEEIKHLEEARLTIIYQLQSLLNQIMDYVINPANNSPLYQQILKEKVEPEQWVQHIDIMLNILLECLQNIERIKKENEEKKKLQKEENEQNTGINDDKNKAESNQQKIEESKQLDAQEEIEDEDLNNVEIPSFQRSQSTVQHKEKTNKKILENLKNSPLQEFISKKEYQIQTSKALNLFKLIQGDSQNNQKKGYNFINSPKIWQQVIKIILNIKSPLILLQNNVFDTMMKMFLESNNEIQLILLSDIIQFACKLANYLKQEQTKLFKSIITYFFQIIKNIFYQKQEKFESCPSRKLLNGFIDVLFDKQYPRSLTIQQKSDSSESSSKKSEQQQQLKIQQNTGIEVKARLCEKGITLLLTETFEFLINYVNIGGKDGALCAQPFTISKLEIAQNLLNILLNAKDLKEQNALQELFKKQIDHKIIKNVINQSLTWLILNRYLDKQTYSPSTELLNDLNAKVLQVYSVLAVSQDYSILAIQQLFEILNNFDKIISSSNNIKFKQIYNYSLQSNQVLEEIFDLLVKNEAVANYFVFEANGINYLLQRINSDIKFKKEGMPLKLQNKNEKNVSIPDISAHMNKLREQSQQKKLEDAKTSTQTTEQIKTFEAALTLSEKLGEEFGTNITLIKSKDEKEYKLNWAAEKSGGETNVYEKQIEDVKQNENSIFIELQTEIEIQQIVIGLNFSLPKETEHVVALPSNIILEAGQNQNFLQSLGTIEQFNDLGYQQFQTQTYVKNFQTIPDNSNNISLSFQPFQSRKVKFLKLIFQKPVLTLFEQESQLSQWKYKNVKICLRFLSITGIQVQNFASLNEHFISLQQGSAIKILRNLSVKNFKTTLKQAANNSELIKQIKTLFPVLSSIRNHEDHFYSFIQVIATENSEIGDWVLNNLLKIERDQPHAKLITEIITQDTAISYHRLQKLNQFIQEQINILSHTDEKVVNSNIKKLTQFITSLTHSLHISSSDMITKSQKPEFYYNIPPQLELQISEKTIEQILNIIDTLIQNNSQTLNNQNVRSLTKYLVSLLITPQPYKQPKQLYSLTLEKIWALSLQQINYFGILAPFIIGNAEGVNWIMKNQGEKLDQLLEIFLNLFAKCSPKDENQVQKLSTSLEFLVQLTQNSLIKQYYQQKNTHLTIYQELKIVDQNSKSIIKDFNENILTQVINLMKNVILGDQQVENTFAQLLKQDLEALSEKIRKDKKYFLFFMIPLLYTELQIPVCLQPYNGVNNRWGQTDMVAQSRQKVDNNEPNQLEDCVSIQTTLLTDKQKQSLLQNIKHFTKKTGKDQKLKSGFWKPAVIQKEEKITYLNDIMNKVLKKPPFLIVMTGKKYDGSGDYVFGYFTSAKLEDQGANQNGYQILKYSKDSFMFYYDKKFSMHFELQDHPNNTTHQQGYLYNQQSSPSLAINDYNGYMSVNFCYYSVGGSSFYINLAQHKPIDKVKQSLPTQVNEAQFKQAQYFVFEEQNFVPEENIESDLNIEQQPKLIFPGQFYNQNNCLNMFRAAPVYQIPSSFNYQQMLKKININGQSIESEAFANIKMKMKSDQQVLTLESEFSDIFNRVQLDKNSNYILDLEYDQAKLMQQDTKQQEKKTNDDQQKQQQQQEDNQEYKKIKNLLQPFESCGGIKSLFNIILASFTDWKNRQRADTWKQYLEELINFMVFPNFLNLLLQNKPEMQQLFQLLQGEPDESDEKIKQEWDEKERKSLIFSYKLLSEVFAQSNDKSIRQNAIENGFFDTILNKIALVTKEYKRTYQEKTEDDEFEQKQNLEEAPFPVLEKQESEVSEKQTAVVKGVGYKGATTTWDVGKFLEDKKLKSEIIESLLKILETFLEFKNWVPQKSVIDSLCGSVLLPFLENNLRGGSLLDMSKDYELILRCLSIIKQLALNKGLIVLLQDLDSHWVPRQKESIYKLLSDLNDTTNIFLKVSSQIKKEDKKTDEKKEKTEKKEINQINYDNLDENYDEVPPVVVQDTDEAKLQAEKDEKISNDLAKAITSCFEIVEKACSSAFEEEYDAKADEKEMKRILNLPLSKKYVILLQDLRFDYVSYKEDSYKIHHYKKFLSNNNPPQKKLVRLAQELADMAKSLPIEHTNSIFVRCDQDRVDVMKALIFGSAGTPYGHGAFVYDVYFDDTYPDNPPKVNLSTTGAGKVRFNPNLYACGKVCLSLLGTWRGQANENWDAKLSTYLQVLVSIQAIVMSDYIYFNEPGYEHEQGTEKGEKSNEGYSNIVRYCNVKYAMLDAIQNPPKGFETVVRRHFYLKQDEIMDECRRWIKYAKAREADYNNGLTSSHNHQWCQEFNSDKNRYHNMLVEVVAELEKALKGLAPPTFRELKKKQQMKKKKITQDKQDGQEDDINTNKLDFKVIDTTYEDKIVQKTFDVNDAKVLDQWSRYLENTNAIDALKKQAETNVFLSGLGPLGVEIAKNIVMAGVKEFVIHDTKVVEYKDLSGQFFVGEADIGKNRAESSLKKIKALNQYVVVKTELLNTQIPLDEKQMIEVFKFNQYKVIVLTESNYATQIAVNNFCRKNNIKFIAVDVYGPFARLFNDFGDNFVVEDKTGDEPVEVFISKITNEEKGKVSLLEGLKHPYEDGDEIIISSVEGMGKLEGENNKTLKYLPNSKQDNINGSVHKIQVINFNSFYIGDTRGFGPYVRNGIARNVKQKINLQFKPLEKCLNTKEVPFDPNMMIHDFMKVNHSQILHVCFNTLDKFVLKFNRLPTPWDLQDTKDFYNLSEQDATFMFEKSDLEGKYLKLLTLFSFTVGGSFPPLAAFMGGYASQEIVKAITNKFMPTHQFFYTDVIEVLPDLPQDDNQFEEFIKNLDYKPKQQRQDGVRMILGGDLMDKIAHCNLFMVGCGAIGCELLKNFAMISLGTGKGTTGVSSQSQQNQQPETKKRPGRIIITDPDHIETSNLNRQFLFRAKHIRLPKSQTATASIIQMNPLLEGHIIARLDKICEQTSHIFTDKFFEELTIVANALDSVPARRYVDSRCVKSRIPLLESGTLGPKGHVQVILPFQTESYSSLKDPGGEEGEIPICTLKMFPEETMHCVEWARDKFGKMFTLRPKLLLKIIQNKDYSAPYESDEIRSLRESIKLLKGRPNNFEDCVRYSTRKFYKYYRNDIMQLMHTYPPDFKTKDGEPFWKLPKKRPTPIEAIDANNLLHASFITALSVLRAKLFHIALPEEFKEFRTDKVKVMIAEIGSKIQVPTFKPSEEKSKALAQEIEKNKVKTQEQKDKEQQQEEEKKQDQLEELKIKNEGEKLFVEFEELRSKLPQDLFQINIEKPFLYPQEFEKDEDDNGHIDFVYSLANCRSVNYELVPMEWFQVKLKAGRIVPALATTTAAISGLQVIELVKVLKKEKLDKMKSAFLNLAVPVMQLSEPGTYEKIKLHKDLTVNLWDRWDVKLGKNIKLIELFEYLVKTYQLKPVQIFQGSKIIFTQEGLEKLDKKQIEERLQKKMADHLEIMDQEYVDLNVIFTLTEGGKFLEGTPVVRIYFSDV